MKYNSDIYTIKEILINKAIFHNPDYDDRLVNKQSWIIHNFIDDYGYNPDDFIIRGSRIFYPSNF